MEIPTTEKCTCENCIDYNYLKKWRESEGKLRWRNDGRCGTDFPLPDGSPAECDPHGENPCCDHESYGNCTNDESKCLCSSCIDFRVVKTVRESGDNCTIARLESGFLINVCFNKTAFKQNFKCAHSDLLYELLHDGKDQYASEWCPNDLFAYQACGISSQTNITNTDVLCGGYFCEQSNHNFVECIGDKCKLENRECSAVSHSNDATLCDDKCESRNCEDESRCNGYRYGVHGRADLKNNYAPVSQVCNDFNDLYDSYNEFFNDENNRDYSDEKDCAITNRTEHTCTHYKKRVRYSSIHTIPILNYTRCSVFDLTNANDDDITYPYCFNYLDQTNCSDTERVGGYCKVNGFMSSVSKFMVCYKYDQLSHQPVKICDEDINNNCLSPSKFANCSVHKHQMCDGLKDCLDGSDEVHDMCENIIDKSILNCTRTFLLKSGELGLPVSWIMDNETDCMNREDENIANKIFCPGEIKRFKLPGKNCQDIFKCSGYAKSYVEFELLCDGIESCGDGGENEVCKIARDLPTINKIATFNGTIQSVCNESISTCESREFKRPWGDIFGTKKIMYFPKSKVNCNGLFGEHFLFLSCMNLCKENNARCPLENGDRKLLYNSCRGQYLNRTYTLGNNSFLTFLDQSESGQYHQDYYQCNNKRCVEYKQVCDLIDDCGDMSDEFNCSNHMVCRNTLTSNASKRQFIALSQKCDGLYDCLDLSDECNEDCGREIFGNWVLKIMCWFMGILAIVFNLFTVIHGTLALKNCETEQMMICRTLMSLIGSGDLIIGIYLIILSIYDSIIFGKEFCSHQAEWLTGTPCLVLGVISTLGSQLSLFTMTILSVIRMYGLTCKPMRIPGPVNKKSFLKAISLVMASVTVALVASVTPLVPSLEDYFVQGMYYDSSYKVFIGFPNKDRHVNILQSYYKTNTTIMSTNISIAMSWKEIGERVDGMFTQDVGILTRSPVHFYGNDGMCLFKYFVRTNDARRSRQSTNHIQFTGDPVVWNMLAVNLCCFIIITCCYIVITLKSRQSSQRSGQHENEERQKNERAIQNKIMIIIITDFLCWIPFIIISGLHNLDYIDASHWYASFAMIVLPLNSVINPLVYDKALGELMNRAIRSFQELGYTVLAGIKGLFQNNVHGPEVYELENNVIKHDVDKKNDHNQNSDDDPGIEHHANHYQSEVEQSYCLDGGNRSNSNRPEDECKNYAKSNSARKKEMDI